MPRAKILGYVEEDRLKKLNDTSYGETWFWKRKLIVVIRKAVKKVIDSDSVNRHIYDENSEEKKKLNQLIGETVKKDAISYLSAMAIRYDKVFGFRDLGSKLLDHEAEMEEIKKFAEKEWEKSKLEIGGVNRHPAIIHGFVEYPQGLDYAIKEGLDISGKNEIGETLLHVVCSPRGGSVGGVVLGVLREMDAVGWQKQTKACGAALMEKIRAMCQSNPDVVIEMHDILIKNQKKLIETVYAKKKTKTKTVDGKKNVQIQAIINSFLVCLWSLVVVNRKRADSATNTSRRIGAPEEHTEYLSNLNKNKKMSEDLLESWEVSVGVRPWEESLFASLPLENYGAMGEVMFETKQRLENKKLKTGLMNSKKLGVGKSL